MLLAPAGLEAVWEGAGPGVGPTAHPHDLILAAGEQLGRQSLSGVELRNVFQTRDPTIDRFVHVLIAELDRAPHPSQRLITEAMSCAPVAHLLRSYNLLDPVVETPPPALGRRELERIVAYIEDNIEYSIGLDELAGLVNVSRFHFARLFKRSMGMTQISYLEGRRIRRPQALILESDLPFAEIALMTGFADQSHFTRRFHRHVGCPPGLFARDNDRRRAAARRVG